MAEDAIEIRQGMPVYGSDGRPIGPVEEVTDTGVRVNGRLVRYPALARVTEDGLYLKDPGDYLRVKSGPRQWKPNG